MARKIKLYANMLGQHYIIRPLFIFEIKVTKYAPIVLKKPWVIEWTYKSQGRKDVPGKWYDRILWIQAKEVSGYSYGTSLNVHNWCQILANIAWNIAYFRKYPVIPVQKSFYFFGKKIFSWKV